MDFNSPGMQEHVLAAANTVKRTAGYPKFEWDACLTQRARHVAMNCDGHCSQEAPPFPSSTARCASHASGITSYKTDTYWYWMAQATICQLIHSDPGHRGPFIGGGPAGGRTKIGYYAHINVHTTKRYNVKVVYIYS